MAVLGQFGTVTLSREWPAPTLLSGSRLQRGNNPSIDLSNLAFQSGDEVLIVALRGIPAGVGTGGYAPCPDGHAFWTGSSTAVGPALTGRTGGGGFWSQDSSSAFWESGATTGWQQTISAFIHRDVMDDVRLYSTEIDAINGGQQGLIPLRNVSPGPMLILSASSVVGYQAAAVSLMEDFLGVSVSGVYEPGVYEAGVYDDVTQGLVLDVDIANGEQPASNLIELPAILTDTAADASERGWLIQCDLTGWVFEMDAQQLDENAIGQAFGESAKGMLSGAGSFNGEIDHSRIAGEQSGLGILKLMMLTGQGGKARAQFQLMDQRSASAPLVRERVYYETDILLGKTAVDTQATDVIKVSAQFVATGAIKLAHQGA